MKNAEDLQKEINILKEQRSAEKEKNKIEKNIVAERDTQIAVLNEQLKHLLNKRFSPSSEKSSPDQLGLFNEAEELATDNNEPETKNTTTVKSHTRKTKPRVTIPENLPREDIIHDIPNAEKTCPHDGSVLKPIGSDDHEQLEIIPAKIKVIRHKRLKYACPCSESYIVTASKPKQPIEKSIASPSLLAYIAVQKYADALPLYRQSEMFKPIGIELDRTNMTNWIVKCGELVQPLINLLIEHLHKQPYLHMNETTLQVLEEPGKTAQSKSYMWVMAHDGHHPASVFHYAESRSQQVPINLLSQDNTAIMVDGYGGYQNATMRQSEQYARSRLAEKTGSSVKAKRARKPV